MQLSSSLTISRISWMALNFAVDPDCRRMGASFELGSSPPHKPSINAAPRTEERSED